MHVLARLHGHRWWVGLAIVASLMALTALPASAHTGFESSSPADGDIVDEPVSDITLTFTGDATPAGDGFVILDPAGVVRVPDETTSGDNLTWTLRFDEPLTDGVVGVRWKVAAPDAHPIEGSFSFTVTALPPTTTAAPSTTTSSAVTATPSTTAPSAIAPPTTATTVVVASEAGETVAEPEIGAPEAASTAAAASTDLEDFLDTSTNTAAGATVLGGAGRIVGLLGVVVAAGGAIFAAFVLRGDQRDIRAVLRWVRRGGVVIMFAALIEAIAQVATLGSGWSALWSSSGISDALSSSFGLAVALRLIGGLLIATGARLDTHTAAGRDPFVHDGDEAWKLSTSPAAFVGVGLVILSFLFDGHTVSEGPRWLHAIANLVHVTAAVTWAGGVTTLAFVIGRRHRIGADMRALQLAVRFSVVATAAIVAAGAAGTVLAIVILDSLSELWSTPWGRLLLIKVGLVLIAAIGGGYNHRVMVPELGRAMNDATVAHRFRTVVTIEAAALVAVAIVTALLIGASSA